MRKLQIGARSRRLKKVKATCLKQVAFLIFTDFVEVKIYEQRFYPKARSAVT